MSDSDKILVVDDASINRMIIRGIFKDDFEILEAEDGESALAIMREHPDDIVVVMLDISMPVLDGYGVLKRMADEPLIADIPVIVVTAANDSKSEVEALRLGAVDFVSKPIEPDITRQRVRNILHARELEDMRLRNKLLEEQNEAQRQLAVLLANIPGGVFIIECEPDGQRTHVIYYNDMVPRFLGYSADDFPLAASDDITTLLVPEDAASLRQELCKVIARRDENWNRVVRTRDRNGNIRWFSISASLFGDAVDKIQYYCACIDVSEEKHQEEIAQRGMAMLKHSAEFDELTDVYNRKMFYTKAGVLIRHHPDIEFSLVRWNIERFKLINDLYGQLIGDEVLRALAGMLKKLYIGDALAVYGRLGNDNFAVCLPSSRVHPETLLELATEAFRNVGIKHKVDASLGICEIEDRSTSIDLLCDQANYALQTIKGEYDRHYAYFDKTLRENALREENIRNMMADAIQEHQFVPFFQPIYSLSYNSIISAEVLARWIHPERGLLSPAEFIPLFEETGFVSQLDYYIWEEACRYLQSRKKAGLPNIPLSVNISRKSLYDSDLFDKIVGLTERYDIEHELLRFEITETAYTDNPAQLLKTTHDLQDNGFLILMDDFGSGYSSLNTLKDIPVDYLKIDMGFLKGFETSSRAGNILASAIRMADRIGLPVIAEGVETPAQMSFLRSIGCDRIQGYCFSKPLPREKFEQLLTEDLQNISSQNDSNFARTDFDEILGKSTILSNLMENVFDGIAFMEMNSETRKLELIRANEGYYRILECKPVDFADESRNIVERIEEDNRSGFLDACTMAATGTKPVHFSIRRRNRTGGLVYLNVILKRIGGTDLHPLLSLIFEDVTSEVNVQQALEKQRGIYSLLLENSTAIVFDYDRDHDQLICSFPGEDGQRQSRTVNEYRRRIATESSICAQSLPDYIRAIDQACDHPQNGQTDCLACFDQATGPMWYRANYRSIAGGDGRVFRIVGIAENVQYERDLEQTQEMNKAYLDTLFSRALITVDFSLGDQPSKVRSFDQRYTDEFYDWDLYANISHHRDLINPEDLAVFDAFWQKPHLVAMSESVGPDESYEMRIKKRDDSWAWVRSTVHVSGIEGDIVRGIIYTDLIDEQKRSEEKLRQRAEYDAVTGLYNRGMTEELVNEFLALPPIKRGFSAFIIFDIDDFKGVNDTYGHLAGDRFLECVGVAMRNHCRRSDIVGRIGGDEHIALLEDIGDSINVTHKIEQFMDEVQSLHTTLGFAKPVTISVGITYVRDDDKTFDDLMSRADHALYVSKRSGKNRYSIA